MNGDGMSRVNRRLAHPLAGVVASLAKMWNILPGAFEPGRSRTTSLIGKKNNNEKPG
ncbi:MAG: hypothetical protein P4M00_00405 [Azospirillaceae bacterium]|nr:hypothetical protein [Azospirillaceae bacterium]